MTVTLMTEKGLYIFDNAEYLYIKETNLSIQQKEEEFGRGFVIEEDKNTD